ncbi:hypothetical protein [Arthrobacter sp. JSM 101049]|uniref:hypothetical protein n=1 Tax=Arthrobacter sp. JSM 101049 TaxID=929097 RepID=UPI0035664614
MGSEQRAAGDGYHLLELRIHGVLNTPPYQMLETTPDRVVVSRGDRLAGFSTYRTPRPATAPQDRRVEAYAWGRLARFTGVPALGAIGDALVKVLWFALAPFGLANTAYWSRSQIGTGSVPDQDAGTGGQHRWIAHTISTGRGAGTMRLYGLLLSLLFITTAATVAWDMIARQCLDAAQPEGSPAATCPGAATVLAPFAGWSGGAREAVLLVLPLLSLAAVVVLPLLGRTRYLTGPSRPGRVPPGTAPVTPGAPLLAQRDVWLVGSGMGRLRRIHSGAALSWLAAIVAFDHSDALGSADGPTGWHAVAWPLATGVAALLTVGGAVWIVKPQAQVAGDRPRRHVAYLAAGALVLAGVIGLGLADPAGGRGGRAGAMAATVIVLAVALALAVLLAQSEQAARSLGGFEAPGQPSRGREVLGWNGRGPFVLGSLAAGFALLLSFAVVLGAGWVLRGPTPPLVYVLQGAGFLVLLVVALSWLALRQAGIHRRAVPLKPGHVAAIREELLAQAGHWTTGPMIEHAAEAVYRARRKAALLRRMEVYLGWLGWAVFVGICVGWAALVPSLGGAPTETGGAWGVLRALGDLGLWAGMIAVVVLYLLSRRSEARPLGLLWDLMCFLPTQAHPFGPSCYAERVVPEVADRIVDWFADTTAQPGQEQPGQELRTRERRLVISAHSMGIVLAVAALFQLGARGLAESDRERIGLLSYGCQLRRYFSRFFPAVCGPDVLSLVPSGPPSATAHDPWPTAPAGEPDGKEGTTGPGPVLVRPGSLGSVMGDRWLNLYRPTDPLGFPARYVGGGPGADRRAASYRERGYQFIAAGHGHYLESAAYVRAFADLRGRLG